MSVVFVVSLGVYECIGDLCVLEFIISLNVIGFCSKFSVHVFNGGRGWVGVG